MMNEFHSWHASGVIGSLDSMDMCQQAKLWQMIITGSIGLPAGLLAYYFIFYP